MTPDLRLVYGCPRWCAEDHTVQAEADREYHAAEEWELRLPDGTLLMSAQLVREPDAGLPQLAVSGPPPGTLLDNVALLDTEDTQRFENALQAFTARVQRTRRVLAGQSERPGKSGRRVGDSKDARAGWRETRLFLAERDGRRCFYCRTEFDELKGVSIDHYVPYSLMPCNMPANLVLACQACNETKRDRLTWSMTAVLLAWQRAQLGTVPDWRGVTVTAGREALAAGEQPSREPAVAACS